MSITFLRNNCNTFSDQDWKEAREFLDNNFDQLADRLVDRGRRNQCRCPDPHHEDSKPSAHIYRDHIHCFSCGGTWYAPQLIGLVAGISTYKDQLREGYRILGALIPKCLEEKGVSYTPTYTKKEKPVIKAAQGLDEIRNHRHGLHQKLCDRLSLNPEHQANLLDRGMSEILTKDYLSVGAYEKINIVIPGSSHGKLLNNADGFLCPVSQYGSVVAYQIRTTDKANKYKWLSNQGDYKLNGESPLSIHVGADTDYPLLSEGFVKSDLIHSFTGVTTIGAAGGNWLSGKSQILEYCDRYHPKGFRIFADSDSLSNSGVAKKTINQCRELEEMGYEVAIGDYGQLVGKAIPSPDDWLNEGGNFAGINWIPLEEFEKRFKSLERKAKAEKRKEADELAFQGWLQSQSLSDAEKISGKFFTPPIPEIGDAFFGKAPTGTGKTTNLKKIFSAYPDLPVLMIVPTRSLGKSAARELNLHYYQDLKDEYFLERYQPGTRGTVLTLASLHLMRPEWFDGKIVVLDEVTAIISQLLFFPEINKAVGNLSASQRYLKILKNFTEGLKRSAMAICLDAYLTQAHVDFLSKYLPGKKIKAYQMEARSKRPIYYHSDPNMAVQRAREFLADAPVPYNKIAASARGSKPDAASVRATFCSDARKGSEAFPEIWPGNWTIANSHTIADEPELQKFLENPDEWLENGHHLSYSPSLQTGFDIQSNFDIQIAELMGVLDPALGVQLINRTRNCSDRFLAIPSAGIGSGKGFTEPEIWKELWQLRIKNREGLLDEHLIDFAAYLAAQSAYEQDHFERCILALLQMDGYDPQRLPDPVPGSDAIDEQFTDEKRLVGKRDFQKLADAPIPDEKRFKALEKKDNLTTDESAELQKHWLNQLLPGIESDLLQNPVFLFWLKDLKEALKTRWLYDRADDPSIIEWQQFNLATSEATRQTTFKNRWQKVLALKKLNLETLPKAGDEEWIRFDSPEVQAIKKAYKNSKELQAFLMLRIPKYGQEMKWLRSLIGKLGGSLINKQFVEGDKNIRKYQLSWEPSGVIKNLEDWKAMTDKELAAKLAAKFSAATLPAIDKSQQSALEKWQEFVESKKIAETQTGHDLDPLADQPISYNKIAASARNFEDSDLSYDPLFEDAPDEIFAPEVVAIAPVAEPMAEPLPEPVPEVAIEPVAEVVPIAPVADDDPYQWIHKQFRVISGALQGLMGVAQNNPVQITKRLPSGEYRRDWGVGIWDGIRRHTIFCDELELVENSCV